MYAISECMIEWEFSQYFINDRFSFLRDKMIGAVHLEYGNFENGNFNTNLSLKNGWLVY